MTEDDAAGAAAPGAAGWDGLGADSSDPPSGEDPVEGEGGAALGADSSDPPRGDDPLDEEGGGALVEDGPAAPAGGGAGADNSEPDSGASSAAAGHALPTRVIAPTIPAARTNDADDRMRRTTSDRTAARSDRAPVFIRIGFPCGPRVCRRAAVLIGP
jgi:hypothetical protein